MGREREWRGGGSGEGERGGGEADRRGELVDGTKLGDEEVDAGQLIDA